MPDLMPDLLPRIEAHRLDGLDIGPDNLFPYFEGYSIANLPDSVCHWLGVPTFGAGPLAQDLLNRWGRTFQSVVLLVVDGLGLNSVQKGLDLAARDPAFAVWGQLASEAVLAPVTSVVPSTTSSALTTFWTGRTPAEHGVVGYEMYLKEYGLIANTIKHIPASFGSSGDAGILSRAGFDPRTFLPVPTLGPHLAQHGVRPYAFQHISIAHSGLSTMLFPEVKVMPFGSQSDLWVSLAGVLDARPDERKYLYIYWSDLDDTMHRFGPQNERVHLEFSVLSQHLKRFVDGRRARGQGDTLFILTADHGHIGTPKSAHMEMRNHPDLLDCMVMIPSGEARLPLVYLRPGREEGFLQYLHQAWPRAFHVIRSEDALRAGLFGSNACARLPDRIGDFVVIPQREDAYWWFSLNRDNHLLGRHGGLSRTEMLCPFFAFVF